MTRPRIRIAWLAVIVAIAALDFLATGTIWVPGIRDPARRSHARAIARRLSIRLTIGRASLKGRQRDGDAAIAVAHHLLKAGG